MLSLPREVSTGSNSGPGSGSASSVQLNCQTSSMSHQQRMLDLSTPCSVAPTVVKESAPFDMQQKSRRSLVLKFSNRVPKDLARADLDFQKLWTILRELGWKYKNGDDVYSNFYLAPNLKVKDARLHSEKFGRAEDLVDYIIKGKDTVFSAVLEEYFRCHPQVLWPSTLQVHDIKWMSLWQILKSIGWKYYTGGLLASHLYAMEGVTKEEAQDKANLGKRSFKTSRDATEYILAHQQDFKVVLSDYFEKHPLPEPDDDDIDDLADAEAKQIGCSRLEPCFGPPFSPIARSNAGSAFEASTADGGVGNIARKRASAAPPPLQQQQSHSNYNNIKSGSSKFNFDGVDFTKTFNRVWPLLKREFGYSYAIGNSLHSYAFLRPGIGGKKEGVEGRDYFMGEEALIKHIATELPDLLKDVMSDQKPSKNSSATEQENLDNIPEILMQDTDKAFNFLWPILKNELHWGHSTGNTLFHYSFLRPGLARKSDGVEGRDYFMGETALLAHVRNVYPDLVRKYFDLRRKEQEQEQEQEEQETSRPTAAPKRLSGQILHKKKSQQNHVFDDEEDEEQEQKHYEAAQQRLAQESKKTKKRLFEASALVCGLTTSADSSASAAGLSANNGNNNSNSGNNAKQEESVSTECGVDFNSVWPHLQDLGWKFFQGSGLASFYYAKPHVQRKSDGKLGIDMFDTEAAVVKEYIQYIENLEKNSDISDANNHSNNRGQVQQPRQDSSSTSSSDTSSFSPDTATDLDYDLEFGNFAWDVLRTEHGWIYKSGNKLFSYCFLKPPLTKKGDGEEGVNLFAGYRALCKHVKEKHPEIVTRYRVMQRQLSQEQDDHRSTKSHHNKRRSISGQDNQQHQAQVQPQPQPPQKKRIKHSSAESYKEKEKIAERGGNTTRPDKALFDFIWANLQQEGWVTGFVQREADGSVAKVLVGEEELLQHVCNTQSNLILEYAKQQKL